VEDQPADTGDLTTGGVPQGKSARRHRLPRQKVRADAAAVPEDAAADDAAAEDAAAEDELEPAADAEPESETDTAAEAETVEAPRRRFPWSRRRAAKPEPAAAEPEPEPEADAAAEQEPEAKAEPEAAAEPESDAESEPAAESEPEAEPVLVPHRTAGRRLKVAAIAAGVLFVGAAAFAGATLQPYIADRAEVQIKFEVAETAANAITTLWTYTPDDMDSLPDRSAKFLGGDFAADYRRYIDAIVAPNKQAQVTNSTQVLGAAVESLTPTEATALVYTNSVATSPVTKGIPSLRYLSYRLSMERRDNDWLITNMTAVTSLDLTPRL